MTQTYKSPERAALDEFAKIDCKVYIWLLVKDGKIAGKITAREGRNHVTHIAFAMFEDDAFKPAVYGYKRVCKGGFIDCGIAEILNENRSKLLEHRVFLRAAWGLHKTWETDFRDSGFLVLSSL